MTVDGTSSCFKKKVARERRTKENKKKQHKTNRLKTTKKDTGGTNNIVRVFLVKTSKRCPMLKKCPNFMRGRLRQCLAVEKLKRRKAEPRTRPAMCVADSASKRGTALPPHVAHVATNPVRRVRTHDAGMRGLWRFCREDSLAEKQDSNWRRSP